MSNSTTPSDEGAPPSRAEIMSGMFAHLVMQNTNMALIFLGHAPNPQTGQKGVDLNSAQYFIDQLEMLEVKTKGNLEPQEQAILKQSLTNLRLMFVEAVNHPQGAGTPKAESDSGPKSPETDEQEMPVDEPALPGETQPPGADAAPKKFTKKYS